MVHVFWSFACENSHRQKGLINGSPLLMFYPCCGGVLQIDQALGLSETGALREDLDVCPGHGDGYAFSAHQGESCV